MPQRRKDVNSCGSEAAVDTENHWHPPGERRAGYAPVPTIQFQLDGSLSCLNCSSSLGSYRNRNPIRILSPGSHPVCYLIRLVLSRRSVRSVIALSVVCAPAVCLPSTAARLPLRCNLHSATSALAVPVFLAPRSDLGSFPSFPSLFPYNSSRQCNQAKWKKARSIEEADLSIGNWQPRHRKASFHLTSIPRLLKPTSSPPTCRQSSFP
ncbi:hypothetical protein B0T09DRAFT_189708 [Sordaria sp. MPI-SDFR-AT-0083]|nr:hypothetical protein B0T09DRAFT_189708 [Sordaria sp. MPI-SDFR-AT-0083]